MALFQNPDLQRALQKAQAKASMQGQPLRTRPLQTQAAMQDIARKQAFAGLGLQKQQADLSHRGRMFQYRMQKNQLKDRKENLPWQLLLGGGTALFSALEGRSRANRITQAEARKQKRHNEIIAAHKQAMDSAAAYRYRPTMEDPIIRSLSY